jgi:hypothetical protein
MLVDTSNICVFPASFSELNDKKKQSILVLINFGETPEKVNIKASLTDMPDLVTIEIVSGNSKFTKNQQISIDTEIELEKFESIVAFYNSSLTPLVSKLAIAMLIIISVLNL